MKLILMLTYLAVFFDCFGNTLGLSAENNLPNKQISLNRTSLKPAMLAALSDYLCVLYPGKNKKQSYFIGEVPIPREEFIAMLPPKLKAQFVLNRSPVRPFRNAWPIDPADASRASFLDVYARDITSNSVMIVVRWSFGNVGAVSYEYELRKRHGKWRIKSREPGIIS